MKRYHDEYPALLSGFDFETLEKDPNSIFGLSADLELNYVNRGWLTFAQENGGEAIISDNLILGTSIGCYMAGPAKDYYIGTYQKILQTGKVWHHDYECSSPDTFRAFHQSVYPLHNRSGLIVLSNLVNKFLLNSNKTKSHKPIEKKYIQKNGVISQCSNCRRVKRASQENVWDWVPDWVEKMPDSISHTFCQICYEYYYVNHKGFVDLAGCKNN